MAFLMMVSVMRHTKSTVKFWFIQNFLSPSFRAFIPHMAAEYGFEYELVTYKWPHWLRAREFGSLIVAEAGADYIVLATQRKRSSAQFGATRFSSSMSCSLSSSSESFSSTAIRSVPSRLV